MSEAAIEYYDHAYDRDRDRRRQKFPFVKLPELQQLSPLHRLVISGAPIEMVRLVYEADPAAMNEDVFNDACRWNTKPDVIDFLGKLVPSASTNQAISEILFDFFEDPREKIHEENFKVLFTLFPEALLWYTYQRRSPLSGQFVRRTPFTDGMDSFQLCDETKLQMIQCLPNTTTSISINLYGKQNLRPAVVAKLFEMRMRLSHLSIFTEEEDCQDLIQGIGYNILGGLESLTLQVADAKSNGSFLPLLNIIAKGDDVCLLEKFKVLVPMQHALLYQDRMIEILQFNTDLVAVTISEHENRYDEDTGEPLPPIVHKQDNIDYYATLNDCGRFQFQDPDEFLDDMVDSLIKVIAKYTDNDHLVPFAIPVLYALMGEVPGKWSAVIWAEDDNELPMEDSNQDRPGLKREASCSLDRNSCMKEPTSGRVMHG
ncbi:hypothetical protein SEMRO_3993_G352380.1 [Seminavis robusta]|uniref:Uncharacterized protein n=1 Tax=Seminavis robusta TaxID=568900 RepID=A0A9N8F4Z1_9STRA|nr:hypothetical protein SEMRO_3993_G352380.1 [Seminavis robusta]|eukprot:Sro3993_g352380.1 n/a (429) ;mRNA; f:1780-3066